MENQYSPRGFRVLPPVVKNLLIINGLFFLATIAFDSAFNIDLIDILGLHYFAASKFSPYQFITYMFMHGGISHIFFNMFALWMFGNVLENVWGGKRFLIYYLITGIGAAIVHYIVLYFQINPDIQAINTFLSNPTIENLEAFVRDHKFHISENSGELWRRFQDFKNDVATLNLNEDSRSAMQGVINFITDYKQYYLNLPNVVGASGAVFGILLAFGMLFPNALIYLYFAIPIKAKYFVMIYGALELYLGISGAQGNVAHFAHLGGMIFGFFLIKYWHNKR